MGGHGTHVHRFYGPLRAWTTIQPFFFRQGHHVLLFFTIQMIGMQKKALVIVAFIKTHTYSARCTQLLPNFLLSHFAHAECMDEITHGNFYMNRLDLQGKRRVGGHFSMYYTDK